MNANALSIKQPWAWACFHGKPVENRSWSTRHRGRLFIHASKSFDHSGYRWLQDNAHLLNTELPDKETFKRGGIIGYVDLVDCVKDHKSPWFFGRYGFVFENPQKMNFAPARGELGIFKFNSEVLI